MNVAAQRALPETLSDMEERIVSRKYNENLGKALDIADQLRTFAIQAAKEADDDSCRGIYSQMIWDSKQYKELVEKEIEGHKKKDKWD
jgi:hypothetical protein